MLTQSPSFLQRIEKARGRDMLEVEESKGGGGVRDSCTRPLFLAEATSFVLF